MAVCVCVCSCASRSKTFEADEDDETLATETLREISALRLMRGKNGHPGILRMLDVIEHEGEVCMVMAKYPCNLTEAVEGKAVGKNKLKIAHLLLSSVAYMHAQGFMHRDIKGDNVMLTDAMEPVLIDLSLAKPVLRDSAMTHSGNVGTAKYIAPEVYRGDEYSLKADLWSAGVVLLEMFTDQILNVDRDKAALAMVEKLTAELPPSKPSSPFLRAMLEPEQEKRVTAAQALSMEPICSKFPPPSSYEKTLAVVPPPTASSVAPEDAAEAATGSKRKKRGGGGLSKKKGGSKQKKKAGSGSSELAARVKEYWELLDCVENATLDAAVRAHHHRNHTSTFL
jgi:serine/threonine protein kinase